MLIDTHCHIDRYPDPMSLAIECETNQITTIAVTNVPSHYEMAVPHIGSMRYVKLSLGFHPLAAAENLGELPIFLSSLKKTQFVGEIGLDYSREGTATRKQQLHAFRSIAEALGATAKFVTLHSRGSAEDVIEILEEFRVKKVVFHWFSGTHSALGRIIEAGHYLSVNTAMLTSKAGQDVLEGVRRDRILTETDGPYVKIGRRVAKPSDVKQVLRGISGVWGASENEVEMQVANNFTELCTSLGLSWGGTKS